jgi:hypothetical protein
MATWEDGPEYAPIERPDEFAVPEAPPLSVAPPHVQPAAEAPVEHPAFGDPADPVIPLAELVPEPEEPRDPTIPYDVASTAITSGDSAWGAVHWQQPSDPAAPRQLAAPWPPAPAAPTTWGEPAGPAWPSEPLDVPNARTPGPTGLPAPGTAQWFAPPPHAPALPPAPASAKDVLTAVTPALIIVLSLGALIHPVAPITLLAAWVLSTRCMVARPQIKTAFVVAIATLSALGVLIGLAGPLDFTDWWNGLSWVALLISWAMVPIVLVLARRALQAGQRPPPPPPSLPGSWG